MGCSFSTKTMRVVGERPNIPDIEISDADIDSLGSKSEDSSLSLNGSIDSDKITLYGGTEFVHRARKSDRSRSVDFTRKKSTGSCEMPIVGAATIIMNSSANNQPSTPQVDHHVQSPPPEITLEPPTLKEVPEKRNLNYRRSSESDVGKVTGITCLSATAVASNSLLNNHMNELKIKSLSFGPRNSRLTVTESQKDFFNWLDDKVAQGKDYSSEDDKSIASFRSALLRKESTESNSILRTPIPQHVR